MAEHFSGMVHKVSAPLTFRGRQLSIDDCMNEKVAVTITEDELDRILSGEPDSASRAEGRAHGDRFEREHPLAEAPHSGLDTLSHLD